MGVRVVPVLFLLVLTCLGWNARGAEVPMCFYELTAQNRARILMGPSRLYAEVFHTDYSEQSALQILVGLIEGGRCQLPPPGKCVLTIDMYGDVQVLNGDGVLKTVLIGRYSDEIGARAAVARFQEAGVCTGLKVKKAR